jgi:hypothetical protein
VVRHFDLYPAEIRYLGLLLGKRKVPIGPSSCPCPLGLQPAFPSDLALSLKTTPSTSTASNAIETTKSVLGAKRCSIRTIRSVTLAPIGARTFPDFGRRIGVVRTPEMTARDLQCFAARVAHLGRQPDVVRPKLDLAREPLPVRVIHDDTSANRNRFTALQELVMKQCLEKNL